MANFVGRLAIHVADRDAGMGVDFGHSSTSLTDLRTASLLLGSTLTGDFRVARVVAGGESAEMRYMRSTRLLKSHWDETPMRLRMRQTTRCAGVKIVRSPCQ